MMDHNILEAIQFFHSKVEFHRNKIVEVYNYIKTVDELLLFFYQHEADTNSRKNKINYFQRLKHEKELAALSDLSRIVEYQESLINLYETYFVVGHEYYFF